MDTYMESNTNQFIKKFYYNKYLKVKLFMKRYKSINN